LTGNCHLAGVRAELLECMRTLSVIYPGLGEFALVFATCRERSRTMVGRGWSVALSRLIRRLVTGTGGEIDSLPDFQAYGIYC